MKTATSRMASLLPGTHVAPFSWPGHLWSPGSAGLWEVHSWKEDVLVYSICFLKFGLSVRKLVFQLWVCLYISLLLIRPDFLACKRRILIPTMSVQCWTWKLFNQQNKKDAEVFEQVTSVTLTQWEILPRGQVDWASQGCSSPYLCRWPAWLCVGG